MVDDIWWQDRRYAREEIRWLYTDVAPQTTGYFSSRRVLKYYLKIGICIPHDHIYLQYKTLPRATVSVHVRDMEQSITTKWNHYHRYLPRHPDFPIMISTPSVTNVTFANLYCLRQVTKYIIMQMITLHDVNRPIFLVAGALPRTPCEDFWNNAYYFCAMICINLLFIVTDQFHG